MIGILKPSFSHDQASIILRSIYFFKEVQNLSIKKQNEKGQKKTINEDA